MRLLTELMTTDVGSMSAAGILFTSADAAATAA